MAACRVCGLAFGFLARVFWRCSFDVGCLSGVLRFLRRAAALGFCRLAFVVGLLPGVRLFAMGTFGVLGRGAENGEEMCV